MGDLTLYTVLPASAGTRALSLATVGLLLSANRLVRLATNPLVGLLLAGARRRRFVLVGFGLGALSPLLYALAPGVGLFLVGRLLWGLAWSLIYIGGYTMLMDVTEASDRGWASGILQWFYFIGLALDPLLGGWLNDRLGFTTTFILCALLSGLGFALNLLALPERQAALPAPPTRLSLLPGDRLRGAFSGWQGRLSGFKAFLGLKNAAINYVYFAANFVGDGILLSTLSLFLKTHYDSAFPLAGWVLPITTAGGLLMAVRAGVSAAIAPAAGRLSDRAGRWPITGLGAALAAAGMGVILSDKTPFGLLLGVILAATGSAAVLTLAPPLAREVNPRLDSGAVLGVLVNSADLGMALAPLVTYALLDRLPLDAIYALAAVILVAGLPLVWMASRQPPDGSLSSGAPQDIPRQQEQA